MSLYKFWGTGGEKKSETHPATHPSSIPFHTARTLLINLNQSRNKRPVLNMFTHTQKEDYVSSVSQTICCFCKRNTMIKARLVHVSKSAFPPFIKGVTTVLQHANSGAQRAEQSLKKPQAAPTKPTCFCHRPDTHLVLSL